MRFLVFLLLWFASATLVLAQQDDVLARAKVLIDARDAAGALQLLAPLEAQRAGDPAYDYLLGIASLDSGDAQAAIFALERAVAVQPDNAQIRAELARAHYSLGEFARAKQEFETVRRAQLPPDAAATVDRFLSAIERGPTSVYAYLEATTGWDSNVNAATGSSTLAIPGLGTVLLGRGLTRDGDSFAGLAAGFSVTHPLTPVLAVTGGVAYAGRFNDQADTSNNGALDGNLGLKWLRGKDVFSASAMASTFEVDNTRFRDSLGGVAQWQHNYNDTTQSSLFVQYSELTYPTQRVRDADRWIVGAAYATALPWAFSPTVYASIYAGREKEKGQNVPHLGHTPVGARVGGQMILAQGWVAFASLGVEERRYGGPEPLFAAKRRDTQTDVRAGLNWRIAPQWLVTPQVSYTDNHSTLTLNRYSRMTMSLAMRREF